MACRFLSRLANFHKSLANVRFCRLWFTVGILKVDNWVNNTTEKSQCNGERTNYLQILIKAFANSRKLTVVWYYIWNFWILERNM